MPLVVPDAQVKKLFIHSFPFIQMMTHMAPELKIMKKNPSPPILLNYYYYFYYFWFHSLTFPFTGLNTESRWMQRNAKCVSVWFINKKITW